MYQYGDKYKERDENERPNLQIDYYIDINDKKYHKFSNKLG